MIGPIEDICISSVLKRNCCCLTKEIQRFLDTIDLITIDCHVHVELRNTAPPWHTCRQRYDEMIWAPVAVTALTEPLKQCHMFLAGATAIGIMSGGTLASRNWVTRLALAPTRMDLEDIPLQYAIARALGHGARQWGAMPHMCRAPCKWSVQNMLRSLRWTRNEIFWVWHPGDRQCSSAKWGVHLLYMGFWIPLFTYFAYFFCIFCTWSWIRLENTDALIILHILHIILHIVHIILHLMLHFCLQLFCILCCIFCMWTMLLLHIVLYKFWHIVWHIALHIIWIKHFTLHVIQHIFHFTLHMLLHTIWPFLHIVLILVHGFAHYHAYFLHIFIHIMHITHIAVIIIAHILLHTVHITCSAYSAYCKIMHSAS